MPNWCSNYIQIEGDKDSIAIITSAVERLNEPEYREKGVFEILVGIEPSVSQESYKEGEWYNSNINYWGTKWDVSYEDCNFEFGETSIAMSPNTAWSPPVNFCVNLAKMYNVSVDMFYSEPGCDFTGKTWIDKNGDKSEEDYSYLEGLYNLDREQFWNELEYTLDGYWEMDTDKTPEEWVEEELSFVEGDDKIEIINRLKEKEHGN